MMENQTNQNNEIVAFDNFVAVMRKAKGGDRSRQISSRIDSNVFEAYERYCAELPHGMRQVVMQLALQEFLQKRGAM